MHWQRHKVGAAHWREMAARGERMPVVIAIGRRPGQHLFRLCPTAAHHRRISLCRFSQTSAGRACARRSPVTSTCRPRRRWCSRGTSIPPSRWSWKGHSATTPDSIPLADLYPKVHVTGSDLRRDPIYPATLVGRPPMEDFYLGHATERIFLPLLKLTVPEIVDYHMPAPGIFHNLVFVSIDKQYPGPGLQGDECALGPGADVAGQGARGGGQGGQCPRPR